MGSACRRGLHSLPGGEHAGLLLDRCLTQHKEMLLDGARRKGVPTPEEQLLDRAAACAASGAYRAAVDRWLKTAQDSGWVVMEASAVSSVAIGLGNDTPLENGLAVHHTYGMPVIPGSALKGVCRRAARQLVGEGKMNQPQLDALFGTQQASAGVTFWDAWFDPDTVDGTPFHRDVITVHHPGYYGCRGSKGWPTDFDDPTPVPFLVIRPGARFLLALSSPDPRWAQYAANLLQWALRNLGVGAKTNAGYGRMALDIPPPPPPPPVQQTWKGVTVRRDKSPVAFHVEQPTGPLTVAGRQANDINNALPPDLRERLKKKPVFLADVTVERQGDAIVVLAIEPASGA